jgi:perosamine synthetase
MDNKLSTSKEIKELFASLPAKRVGELDRKYLGEVLEVGFHNSDKSGICGRFEKEFAEKFGVEFAIAHNSGTATMHTCLMAAGIGPGDEVIVPSLTMASTALVVVQCYAVPVFADIDPRTFTIDPEDIRRKITPHTKAIIPVSIYGLSPDMDPIMKLAKEHNLLVIEDDAQCFLGSYKKRLVGTIGHAASFSFQGSKHMTTGGEGGMVITNDPKLALGVRKACALGYSALAARPGEGTIPREVRSDWEFKRHDSFGYNYRMPSPCAAIGLGQLARLDDMVKARQACDALYRSVLAECDWITPQHVPDGCVHAAYTTVANLKEGSVDFRTFRKKFMSLGGEVLYGCWAPVHLEPVFRTMSFFGSAYRAPHFHPLYKGSVKSYQPGDCPVLEKMQPRFIQLKNGYTSWDKIVEQAEILGRTIASFK